MEIQPRARRELLDWLRSDFKCSIDRIEECGSGAMYLQIMDRLYPGRVPMNRVNWSATTEYDMLKNFKLLQEVFKCVGVSKGFNIDNLIKKKFPDNLELLQWFYTLYEKRLPDVRGDYDPMTRRKLSVHPLPPWAMRMATSTTSHPIHHLTSFGARQRTLSHAAAPPPPLQPSIVAPKREREKVQFYESKLRAIAAVCAHTEDPEFIDKKVVQYILHSKDAIEIDLT